MKHQKTNKSEILKSLHQIYGFLYGHASEDDRVMTEWMRHLAEGVTIIEENTKLTNINGDNGSPGLTTVSSK